MGGAPAKALQSYMTQNNASIATTEEAVSLQQHMICVLFGLRVLLILRVWLLNWVPLQLAFLPERGWAHERRDLVVHLAFPFFFFSTSSKTKHVSSTGTGQCTDDQWSDFFGLRVGRLRRNMWVVSASSEASTLRWTLICSSLPLSGRTATRNSTLMGSMVASLGCTVFINHPAQGHSDAIEVHSGDMYNGSPKSSPIATHWLVSSYI